MNIFDTLIDPQTAGLIMKPAETPDDAPQLMLGALEHPSALLHHYMPMFYKIYYGSNTHSGNDITDTYENTAGSPVMNESAKNCVRIFQLFAWAAKGPNYTSGDTVDTIKQNVLVSFDTSIGILNNRLARYDLLNPAFLIPKRTSSVVISLLQYSPTTEYLGNLHATSSLGISYLGNRYRSEIDVDADATDSGWLSTVGGAANCPVHLKLKIAAGHVHYDSASTSLPTTIAPVLRILTVDQPWTNTDPPEGTPATLYQDIQLPQQIIPANTTLGHGSSIEYETEVTFLNPPSRLMTFAILPTTQKPLHLYAQDLLPPTIDPNAINYSSTFTSDNLDLTLRVDITAITFGTPRQN